MRPAHRNLGRLQPVVPRQVQQFRIEAEPLDALLLEDNAATLAAKGLKSALCIHERQPQNDAHDTVENNPGKFAERRFVDLDQFAVHRARADR